jgi:hypothetical protein
MYSLLSWRKKFAGGLKKGQKRHIFVNSRYFTEDSLQICDICDAEFSEPKKMDKEILETFLTMCWSVDERYFG